MADKGDGSKKKDSIGSDDGRTGNINSLRRKSLTLNKNPTVSDEKSQLLRQSSLSSQVRRSSSVDKHRQSFDKKQ